MSLDDTRHVNNRVWINNRQPQTLYIAQLLLYMRGALALFAVVIFRVSSVNLFGSQLLGTLWLLLITVGAIGAAYGIANERKLGYRLGLAAAFAPFAIRLQLAFDDSLIDAIFGDKISLVFDVAIVALLLHQMSAEHQRVYFK